MKNVKNEPKSGSGIPLAIIALVLVLAVAGGWWFYSASKPAAGGNTSRSAANANRTQQAKETYENAPPGAPLGVNLLGAPTAAVTVEEFADFQCGACASVHPAMKEIASIYGPRIKFVFRHYPLSIPAHDKAYNAAVAVEAAGMQGKFWPMQNELFMNQQAWTTDPNYQQTWAGYAQKLGMDVAKFQADMAAMGAKERVDADMRRGRTLGVNSTPTIFINGRPVPFPEVNVSSMRQLIDSELQRAQTQQPAAPAGAAPVSAPAANSASNQR